MEPRLCISLLIMYSVCCLANATPPKVTIKQGTLRGKELETNNKRTVYTFLGIPYAKPPQRFQLAEEAKPWKGEYDATKNRSICAQQRLPDLHIVGTENCLFANVYTTKLPDADGSDLAPVIVFIHGGIFQHMSGDFEHYNPTLLLGDEPDALVYVSFNYRLGVLGFLSTEDEVVPGNLGLKDQVVLLKWVRDNIAAFGGDPSRVTLMGENAGAVSVHMHMLSPLSKGLFQAAISQSGTAITHWAMNRDPIGRTYRLAELMDCGDNTTSTHKIVKCLEEADTAVLIRKSQQVFSWRTDLMAPFQPSVEKQEWSNGRAFLPDYPKHLMYHKDFNPVPWLLGVTSHAGLPHSLQLMLFSNIRKALNDDFEYYAPYYFEIDADLETAKEIVKRMRSFYFPGTPIGQSTQSELSELHTDYYYFVPLVQSAALHVDAKAPPVYVYHFSYQYRKSRLATGVPQGDDTRYVLPNENWGLIVPNNGTEYKVKKRMLKVIRNFIRERKPILEEDKFGTDWPPVDDASFNFIDFGKTMKLNNTFYEKRMEFWREIEDLLISKYTENPDIKDEL